MDYYNILELDKNASDDEIRKTYKRLALKYHPDRNKSPDAEEKFKKIAEAYETLGDPEKRKQYDMFGNGDQTNPFGNNFTSRNMSTEEAQNLFGSFMGGFGIFGDDDNFMGSHNFLRQHMGRHNGFMGARQHMNRHGNHHMNMHEQEESIECTLEDLYNGDTRYVSINDNTHELKIRPGLENGKKFSKYQNLIFSIKELEHDRFIRKGSTLYLKQKIELTYDEAKNGFKKTIRLLNGDKYVLVLKGIPKSSYSHKIIGKGMPIDEKKKVIGYGDMIVEFDVIF